MVLAASFPFSGSFMDPTIDSWPMLNKYPSTDKIIMAKMDKMVQKYAFPDDTTGFIVW